MDGIRDQIDEVREQQFSVTWHNHVHNKLAEFPSSPARERQRSLVLAMPSGIDMAKSELPGLTAALAALYARTGPRTLSRDLNRLRDAELVVRRPKGWRTNDAVISAFLPPTADRDHDRAHAGLPA